MKIIRVNRITFDSVFSLNIECSKEQSLQIILNASCIVAVFICILLVSVLIWSHFLWSFCSKVENWIRKAAKQKRRGTANEIRKGFGYTQFHRQSSNINAFRGYFGSFVQLCSVWFDYDFSRTKIQFENRVSRTYNLLTFKLNSLFIY